MLYSKCHLFKAYHITRYIMHCIFSMHFNLSFLKFDSIVNLSGVSKDKCNVTHSCMFAYHFPSLFHHEA